MRTKLGLGIAMLCVACGGGSTTTSPTTTTTTTTTTTATPTATASPTATPTPTPTAPYELHEWGVVDVPESGAVEISAGAGLPQRPMSVRKPVVYVHLLDGVTETTFGLRVTLGAGTFVEHFPATTVAGTTLEWPHVVAHAAHCGTTRGPVDPSRRAPRMSCTAPDGICEVDELPRYDAPSAACLDVDGAQTALLFYRGQAPSLALPISASRAADLTVTVAASTALDGAPGGLIRLSTALSGPWPVGHVVVSRAAFPAAGASITLPVGTDAITREQGIAELRTSILALGLSGDEADAFMAGWADELFGVGTGATRDTTREAGRWATQPGPRHQDVLLYFLPASAIDPIATLTATPAPRAIRRALLVRIDLGAVSTG